MPSNWQRTICATSFIELTFERTTQRIIGAGASACDDSGCGDPTVEGRVPIKKEFECIFEL